MVEAEQERCGSIGREGELWELKGRVTIMPSHTSFISHIVTALAVLVPVCGEVVLVV